MSANDLGRAVLSGDLACIEGDASAWLGWMKHPHQMGALQSDLRSQIGRSSGETVLLGMGGSSSGAGMLAHSIDTSHPDTIQNLNFEGVNVIASSKSGGTIETVAGLAYALSHGADVRKLTIITDPGTALEQLGVSLGARVIHGDPLTGGRYSALSAFGLAPLLIAGADELSGSILSEDEWIEAFARGHQAAPASGWGELPVSNDPLASFTALWEEQLIAESSGKSGKGVLPMPGSPVVVTDIVAHVQRTHAFTVGLCVGLGVDPFRQPDVESAKVRTFAELSDPQVDTFAPNSELSTWLSRGGPIVLQVFGPLSRANDVISLRSAIAEQGHLVSAGLGPRYLHSTGQIHKGGSASLRFLQVVVEPAVAPERISGRNYSFHELIAAQARGDSQELASRGRDVLRVKVGPNEQLGSLLH